VLHYEGEGLYGLDKMPFKSKAQRSFLYANYPKVAKNWAKKHGTTIQKKTGKLIQKKRRSK